jgi:hypothetical protein
MTSLDDYISNLPEDIQHAIIEKTIKLIEEEKNRPKVGMGVTQIVGSDRYPFTIVRVINDKKIVVTKDSVGPNKKIDPEQSYDYQTNWDGFNIILTLRNNGRWREQGEPTKGGCPWHIGSRRFYQNPSF